MAYSTQLSGRKLKNQLTSTLNESVATGPSSFARRQLELMGWSEGKGLGKNQQGISTHIKVTKRKDEEGLGHEKKIVQQAGDQWWYASVGETLANLQKDKKKKKKNTDEKAIEKKSMRRYTDEELFEATGGARFGMRAQRRAEGKWARTEKDGELKVLEVKAKESMEWNGLGNAKVLLCSNVEVKTSKRVEHVLSSCEVKKRSVAPKSSKADVEADSSLNPLHVESGAASNEITPDALEDERIAKKEKKKDKKSKNHEKQKKRKHEEGEDADEKEQKRKSKKRRNIKND